MLEARRHVVKDKMPALFPEQLSIVREKLQQRSQEGYKVTLTDFWGHLIESCLGDEVCRRGWLPWQRQLLFPPLGRWQRTWVPGEEDGEPSPPIVFF